MAFIKSFFRLHPNSHVSFALSASVRGWKWTPHFHQLVRQGQPMSATLVHKRLSWLRLSEIVLRRKVLIWKNKLLVKMKTYITSTNNNLDYLTAVWLWEHWTVWNVTQRNVAFTGDPSTPTVPFQPGLIESNTKCLSTPKVHYVNDLFMTMKYHSSKFKTWIQMYTMRLF